MHGADELHRAHPVPTGQKHGCRETPGTAGAQGLIAGGLADKLPRKKCDRTHNVRGWRIWAALQGGCVMEAAGGQGCGETSDGLWDARGRRQAATIFIGPP